MQLVYRTSYITYAANDKPEAALTNIYGVLLTALYDILGGENLPQQVLATTKKPLVNGLYSAIPGVAAYADVDILVRANETQLMAIACNNKNASERFLWIKNKATVIAGADTVTAGADLVLPLAALTNNLLVFGEDLLGLGGMYFPTGLTIGVSTSATSFTAGTTTDHYVAYLYV